MGTGGGVNKDCDEVERFFKNPTYEETSGNTNTTSTAASAATAVVMYDTVGPPSKQVTVTYRATENNHMYEAFDKEDENGKNSI